MALKIKPRQEILNEIISRAKHHPKGWKATFGKDPEHHSLDCYISHPSVGMYLLKEYEKNPYVRKGLGTKIARRIDDDIEHKIQQHKGDFGIIQGNIQKILWNISQGFSPETILEAALRGNDLGIRIPVKGQASQSQDTFTTLHSVYSNQQKNLEHKFQKMMQEDGLFTSYS